ncbi:MAG: putative restriction endonuclease [Myxococcota bacterium]|jgi:putative restriction endonuclease
MNPSSVFIAHTHRQWFDNLSRLAVRAPGQPARLDEVNFWSPKSPRPIKRFTVGEPIFFRLGAPSGSAVGRAIVGYGFFADHLDSIDVHLAWDLFGAKNGAFDKSELARILGRDSPAALRRPLGSMLLRDATFWPDHQWIPWDAARGYARSGIQRGRTDAEPANIAVLMAALRADTVDRPADLSARFQLVSTDTRRRAVALNAVRQGQGTFRGRLLKAYAGQCAVTREHTEPVLAAAHIQPYLGPASNHVQNGLLLTQEFHTLFDRGLVAVEPIGDEFRLRVSDLLQERWNNGKRYREYEGRPLHVPGDPELQPSREALEWHREEVYERVA